MRWPVRRYAADTAAPAANTAAVLTYAASTDGSSHVIEQITVGYDAAPTGGSLTITDGGTTVYQVTITGTGAIELNPNLLGGRNAAVVITLAAGGVGVSGRLNVRHSTE